MRVGMLSGIWTFFWSFFHTWTRCGKTKYRHHDHEHTVPKKEFVLNLDDREMITLTLRKDDFEEMRNNLKLVQLDIKKEDLDKSLKNTQDFDQAQKNMIMGTVNYWQFTHALSGAAALGGAETVGGCCAGFGECLSGAAGCVSA